MLTYRGKYNSANVMIDDVEQETVSQIYSFLNHPAFAKTYIAIMPDCHAGAGAVIGFTAKMNEYVIPNVVGVDIGCGVLAINLGYPNIDFAKLDTFIKENIPSGFSIRSYRQRLVTAIQSEYQYPEDYVEDFKGEMYDLIEKTEQDVSKVFGSIGTLGGGNHFIEIDLDNSYGTNWLLIHTGSRNFGLRIANYYQNKAKDLLKKMFVAADAYKGLEYLPLGMGAESYLDAMKVAQRYASMNRYAIADILLRGFFKLPGIERIETVHNYINFEDKIIRKGAVSAQKGERLVIPFNMRDGVAVCTGKGNTKWNCSAPHGAGRILSRKKAKETLSIDEFTSEMEGIYTTTATQDTIDESPMAYKDMNTIVEAIGETVEIEFIMRPVYNFKAGGE